MLYIVHYSVHYIVHMQTWEYPRSKLIYMRELGEGQFGKVLLMRANVNKLSAYILCLCVWLHISCLNFELAWNVLHLSIWHHSLQGIANYGGLLPVAVKTLSSRASHMLEKFVQETNLMKKFCHPNIVSLLGKLLSLCPILVVATRSSRFYTRTIKVYHL